MINKEPMGGTELQEKYLHKYVDSKLLSKVQICTSVPEKIPLHSTKLNILWQKNSYDQENIYPWFQEKSNHDKYDWYVFNSHWTYEKYRTYFNIPMHKSIVIKNGVDNITKTDPYEKGKPIKIIHQNTPWRGLSVLLGAMQLIKNPLVSLDVYSSTEVYENFYQENDSQFYELYEQARSLPNVNYIGHKSNEYIKDNLKKYNMYVYPSVFEETSCISLLESMAAGLYCIVTNYGALFETGAEFPMYVTYNKDHISLAKKFAFEIDCVSNILHNELIHNHLDFQSRYVNTYYNWDKIGASWTLFLKGILKHEL